MNFVQVCAILAIAAGLLTAGYAIGYISRDNQK